MMEGETRDTARWIAEHTWTPAAVDDDQGPLNVFEESEYAVNNCFTFIVDEEGGRFLIDFECDDYFYNQRLSVPLAAFRAWLERQTSAG